MSVGANHQIRCLGITPDMSLIDCAFIRLAQQRYHFKLGNEPNAKRRFNRYYSKDYTHVARHLSVGFCIYVLGEKLKVVKIPLFRSHRLPQPYTEPKEPQTTEQPKKSLIKRIVTALKGNEQTTEEEYYNVYGNSEEDQEDAWTEEEDEDLWRL